MDSAKFHDAMIKAQNRKTKKESFQSKLINPRIQGYQRGLLYPQKTYSMHLFRRISEKAWLVNVLIGHIIDKTIPYLRPAQEKGRRGFSIELKDPDKKLTKPLSKRSKEIQEFFLKTGWDNSLQHEDDLPAYTKKILRDLLTLDQTATEKLWSRGGEILSFEAVDAATILRCTEEGYDGDDKIRFVQRIDSQVVSQYNGHQMLFQYDNPRTDINHYGYGYSKIEQCANLIVASINTFAFNAGSFTEDKLPRGMLLLNGDMGFEEVEQIEDYLIDVMSDGIAGASNKWGIPIVPTGKGGDKASISWQPLGNTQQEMQYSRWQDFLNMGIAAIYGVDIESTGIKNEKGAKIMESGSAEAHKYSDDKGIGNALTFLERHFQNILDHIDPQFRFVFHGFEQEDAKETREGIEAGLKTFKSLNDVLLEHDKEPLDEGKHPWAGIPGILSQNIKELYLQSIETENQGQTDGQPEEEEIDGFGFEKSLSDEAIIIRI